MSHRGGMRTQCGAKDSAESLPAGASPAPGDLTILPKWKQSMFSSTMESWKALVHMLPCYHAPSTSVCGKALEACRRQGSLALLAGRGRGSQCTVMSSLCIRHQAICCCALLPSETTNVEFGLWGPMGIQADQKRMSDLPNRHQGQCSIGYRDSSCIVLILDPAKTRGGGEHIGSCTL